MILSFIAELFTLPWILVNVCIATFVYYFVLSTWSYFSDRNVKFVRGVPFIGSTFRVVFARESMPDGIRRLYNAFPNEKFIGVYDFGGAPRYFIRDPELKKQLGIKDFDHFKNHLLQIPEDADGMLGRSLMMMRDQRWKDMRSILSPAFTGSKMRLMCGLLVDVCQTFCNSLKNESRAMECDVKEIFQRFSTDAIASCAFGVQTDSVKDKENQFFLVGRRLLNFNFFTTIKFIFFFTFPKLMARLKISLLDKDNLKYFQSMVKENIRYREENNIVRNDMINIMMEVKKGMLSESTDLDDEDRELLSFASPVDREMQMKWTDDDLLAQSMLFFFAGFQAISITLCFATHELTVYPEIQARLYNEIQEVKNNLNGKPLTYEVLQKMKYLDMVLNEVLRRWGGGSPNDRMVTKPYTLETSDGTKILLKPGDGIVLDTFGCHMDPQYFPNPEKFIPERFSDDNKHNIISGTYVPFGIGPRGCIASRFAIMECKMFLYHFVDNFKLERSSKTQHPLKLKKSMITIEAENGFWMQLQARE